MPINDKTLDMTTAECWWHFQVWEGWEGWEDWEGWEGSLPAKYSSNSRILTSSLRLNCILMLIDISVFLAGITFDLWESEHKWKIAFPTFGNVNRKCPGKDGNGNSHWPLDIPISFLPPFSCKCCIATDHICSAVRLHIRLLLHLLLLLHHLHHPPQPSKPGQRVAKQRLRSAATGEPIGDCISCIFLYF